MASGPGRWARFRRANFGDIVRAGIELGLARLRLGSRLDRASIATFRASTTQLDEHQIAMVDRIAFVLPRVAARLPWRADCLVQALAAERWLTRNGIATTLTLGVPKDKPVTFEAHAWLRVGTRIVTGGDVSGYVPLARP